MGRFFCGRFARSGEWGKEKGERQKEKGRDGPGGRSPDGRREEVS